jgi:hypothetical protein
MPASVLAMGHLPAAGGGVVADPDRDPCGLARPQVAGGCGVNARSAFDDVEVPAGNTNFDDLLAALQPDPKVVENLTNRDRHHASSSAASAAAWLYSIPGPD